MNEFALQLDHIGIAVKTLDSTIPFYELLGIPSGHREVVPTEKVSVSMHELKNDCRVELLESTIPDGPIGKFVDKRGPGIHHICFRVKNIDALLARLKSAGVRLIDEAPKPGAHNCRVAFIHPSATGGVLIELSEKDPSE